PDHRTARGSSAARSSISSFTTARSGAVDGAHYRAQRRGHDVGVEPHAPARPAADTRLDVGRGLRVGALAQRVLRVVGELDDDAAGTQGVDERVDRAVAVPLEPA